MPKHTLLSEAECEQLLGIPIGRDDLARLYTFEPKDIDLILRRRKNRNRFGFALQLALLRHPGAALALVLDRAPRLPDELLTFIADQSASRLRSWPIMRSASRR